MFTLALRGGHPRILTVSSYLLRIEQIALHNPSALPQFFISCAVSSAVINVLLECILTEGRQQITVTNGGSANPKTFSIPGHISSSDPGYIILFA